MKKTKNVRFIKITPQGVLLVGICGLEPQTSSLSVTRSNQLSYIPEMWWSNRDSNPGPPPCKGGALNS